MTRTIRPTATRRSWTATSRSRSSSRSTAWRWCSTTSTHGTWRSRASRRSLWTLPLLLRRRFPFAAPVFAFAVQIGASFIDPNAFGSEATGLVALLITFWVVGAQDHATQAIAGAAIGCATLSVIAETDDRVDTGGAIFAMVMGAAVTLIAFTLRR